MKQNGVTFQTFNDADMKMAERFINAVTKTLVVRDALRKSEDDKSKRSGPKQKKPNKKDPKRIIDTYV